MCTSAAKLFSATIQSYSFEMVTPDHRDGQSTAAKPGRRGSSYRSFDLGKFDNTQPIMHRHKR